MLTKSAYRKRAQRAFPKLTVCELCGSTKKLQRHHHKGLEDALSVVILCQECHAKDHAHLGTWGKGSRKPRICVVCKKEFSRLCHSRTKTCGRECLEILGRLNANKRWHPEQTDLNCSETAKSFKSLNGLENK